MDIVSHGLWGGLASGRATKRSYLAAFLIGIAPDAISFGPLFVNIMLNLHGSGFAHGVGHRPDPASIPPYVYSLYNLSHSLVVFAATFLLVWLLLKKPFMAMASWGLHITMDIFTHSTDFFPTPFLWPLSDFRINGIPWVHPAIFYPNLVLIAVLYLLFLFTSRKQQRSERTGT